MAERKQSLRLVREGEEATLHFENSKWKKSEIRITTFDGIVAIEAIQDGIRVQAQLLNLRRE